MARGQSLKDNQRGIEECLSGVGRPMLRAMKKSPEHLEALDRVREWTRARFNLYDETTILVAEIACTLPGCPPRETVVAFWIDETRHRFKVFKPVVEVVEDDVPYAWLKNALVDDGSGWECC